MRLLIGALDRPLHSADNALPLQRHWPLPNGKGEERAGKCVQSDHGTREHYHPDHDRPHGRSFPDLPAIRQLPSARLMASETGLTPLDAPRGAVAGEEPLPSACRTQSYWSHPRSG